MFDAANFGELPGDELRHGRSYYFLGDGARQNSWQTDCGRSRTRGGGFAWPLRRMSRAKLGPTRCSVVNERRLLFAFFTRPALAKELLRSVASWIGLGRACGDGRPLLFAINLRVGLGGILGTIRRIDVANVKASSLVVSGGLPLLHSRQLYSLCGV